MSSETTMLLKKRERTQNWMPEEKNALFSLIKLHVNEIENKKIDQAASTIKTLAWQQIYSEFHGKFSADRDVSRIREQWRRMKTQARIEIQTYAEKVRTLGPEAAAKYRPSNLSIKIWQLLDSVRKKNCDTENERSDNGNAQDVQVNMTTDRIHSILDNLATTSETSESFNSGYEIEANDNTEDEDNYVELALKTISSKERYNVAIDEFVKRKISCPDSSATAHVDDATQYYNSSNESSSDKNNATQEKTIHTCECARHEHRMKLQMLQIELERAELERQTAANKLKTSKIKRQLIESQTNQECSQVKMSGERGSGAGKGGGSGGAIRDAGGSFGKMEAAHEDQYFYNLQKEQLKKMRESLHDEISFHEEQIKRHQEAINRHKKRITDMEQKE